METTKDLVIKDNIKNMVTKYINNNSAHYEKELSDIGETTKQLVQSKTSLLKTRLGNLAGETHNYSNIEENLVKMRTTLDRINPNKSRFRFMTQIFGEGNVSKRLIKIASKYKSSEAVIDEIRNSLHSGQKILNTNNSELETLKQHLQDQLNSINNDTMLLQTTIDELENQHENSKKTDCLMNPLLIKLQDFKVMKEATLQFILSVNITKSNNQYLSDAVDRVCNITLQLIYSALSIKIAKENHRKVLNAIQDTKEFASELLVHNANILEDNVKETNELYNSPVLNLDKLKESHNKLLTVIETSINMAAENKSKMLNTISELDNFSIDISQLK